MSGCTALRLPVPVSAPGPPRPGCAPGPPPPVFAPGPPRPLPPSSGKAAPPDLFLHVSLSTKGFSGSALVYLKGERLRADILRPFIGGAAASLFFLKEGRTVFLLYGSGKGPGKHYETAPRSKAKGPPPPLLPWFAPLSAASWISLLRGEEPPSARCHDEETIRRFLFFRFRKKRRLCSIEGLIVAFPAAGKKRRRLVLRAKGREPLTLEIRKQSARPLPESVFSPQSEGMETVSRWEEMQEGALHPPHRNPRPRGP